MIRFRLLAATMATFTTVAHTQSSVIRPVPGAPAGVTAFVDVAVVPMDTERVLPHQTVLVQGGRIAALGPVTTISIPPRAVRIDGRGQYLLPGFGACHGHLGAFGGSYPEGDPRYAELRSFLLFAAGITVLRNVDYINLDPEITGWRKDRWGRWRSGISLKSRDLLWLRTKAAAGKLWSPRLYVAGQWAPIQYVTALPLREDVQQRLPAPRLDSVAAYVAAYKTAGYDFIKLHDETPEIAESVFAAAQRVGMQVGGHVIPGTYEQVLAGGQQVADHLGSPVGGGPTQSLGADTVAYVKSWAADAAARRRAGLWSCMGGDLVGAVDESLIVRALTDSGAKLLIGSDGGSGNPSLVYMVEKAGLTPYQALVTGTKNFGQYLRTLDPHGDETGTIAVGQRADLVLLTGNPLVDIRYAAFAYPAYAYQAFNETAHSSEWYASRSPAIVMVGGRWLAGAELTRRAALVLLYYRLLKETDTMLTGVADTSVAAPVRQALMRLESVHHEQRFALVERFVLTEAVPAGGADSLRGAQRLVELFARQLGEMRAALPTEARGRFDPPARAWLGARAADGYHIAIRGVSP